MELRQGDRADPVAASGAGWTCSTLEVVAEITAGINKSRSEMGTGALYVTVQDLYDGTSIRTARLGRIRVSDLELQVAALRPDDIVLGKSSVKRDGIGYPSRFLGCDEPVVYSGFTYRVRARVNVTDPTYLFYALRSEPTRRWIIDNSQASALTNINQRIANAIPVILPPISEQRAIAAALSDVDALLGGLDRLIAKKRDLKQAAMQQLLTGQIRLPGFSGKWKVKTLGDIVEKIVGGGTPSRANAVFWGNEIPWVTVKDFATFNPWHSQESITLLGLRNSASNLIPAGTLITSTRMALGKAVVYEVDIAINQDLKALFLKPEASVVFLTYWFEHFGNLIDELGSGSTVKGISIGELRRFPFQAPPLPEQTAIAAVLSDMDAELAALEARRDKTRDLKRAMMQELLTGRTRLI